MQALLFKLLSTSAVFIDLAQSVKEPAEENTPKLAAVVSEASLAYKAIKDHTNSLETANVASKETLSNWVGTIRNLIVQAGGYCRSLVIGPKKEDEDPMEQLKITIELIHDHARFVYELYEVMCTQGAVVNVRNATIPVTVITGFLGSGKTTLLNYILQENHGKRIAVIENEFGEVGIDDALVKRKFNKAEEIMVMNNGCICCTVRGDLIQILGELLKRRSEFDYIMVETTGLADPAPIIQTFFTVPEFSSHLRLDGVITVVDSKHVIQHLDEKDYKEGDEIEAVEQIAFADVVLLNKTDLVSKEELAEVQRRVTELNSNITVIPTLRSQVDLDKIMNIKKFSLENILEDEPDFLVSGDEHSHSDLIKSVAFQLPGALDINKLNGWMSQILRARGADIFRMKGILNIHGMDRKFVFHGVHMLFDGTPLGEWGEDEERINRLVFIGKRLKREEFEDSFKQCFVSFA